jgi:hypothetical protein
LPPNTAFIGDSPAPTTTDRAAAEKAAKDAKDAFLRSDAKTNEKIKAGKKVWDEVSKIAPKALLDAYDKAVRGRFSARLKLEISMKHMAAQPTVENANALTAAGAAAAASEKTEEEAFDAIKDALPFDLATRLDWARTETQNALAAEHQAVEANHAAQQAVDSLPPAAPSPPPAPSSM